MESTTEQEIKVAKQIVLILNELYPKNHFWSNQTELIELLKSYHCPYSRPLVLYLCSQKIVTRGKNGYLSFINSHPFYFGNFIQIVDNWRRKKNEYNKKRSKSTFTVSRDEYPYPNPPRFIPLIDPIPTSEKQKSQLYFRGISVGFIDFNPMPISRFLLKKLFSFEIR